MRVARPPRWFVLMPVVLVYSCGSGTEGTTELTFALGAPPEGVMSVSYAIDCGDEFSIEGDLEVDHSQETPIDDAVAGLPVGQCDVFLTAADATGGPVCAGSSGVTVVEGETVEVEIKLICPIDGGQVDACLTAEDLERVRSPDFTTGEPPAGEMLQRCDEASGDDGLDLEACLKQTHGLSRDCADCYGAARRCAALHCARDCLRERATPRCLACVFRDCRPRFRECAGFDFPRPDVDPTECASEPTFYSGLDPCCFDLSCQ